MLFSWEEKGKLFHLTLLGCLEVCTLVAGVEHLQLSGSAGRLGFLGTQEGWDAWSSGSSGIVQLEGKLYGLVKTETVRCFNFSPSSPSPSHCLENSWVLLWVLEREGQGIRELLGFCHGSLS